MSVRATQSGIFVKAHRQVGEPLDLSPWVHRYSDQHPLEGVPSFSLVMEDEVDGVSIFEALTHGDLLEVGLVSTDGRTGRHGLGEYHTVMVGFVRSIGVRQDVGDGGSLTRFAVITGPSFGGVLANDSINYYMALGTLQGMFRTLAEVGMDELGMVRLDRAMAGFMDRVAFGVLRIERPFGGMRDLLGFSMHSVAGEGLFDMAWGNYEGSLWQFLQTYSEPPLHELYHRVLPASELASMAGEVHVPGYRFGTEAGQDNAVAAVIMRPAPFPHLTMSGTVDTAAWEALPLHDLRDERWSMESAGDSVTDKGDAEVVNFVHVHPKTITLDETMQITWVRPLIHDAKWRQFGYKPLSFATNLWGEDRTLEDTDEYFEGLNARLAGQFTRMNEYFEGKMTIRLAPHIRPGHRVAMNLLKGDDTTEHVYYVQSVAHSFAVQGSATTSLVLGRGLHRDKYEDPSWFSDGWQTYDPIRDQFLSLGAIRKEDEPHE